MYICIYIFVRVSVCVCVSDPKTAFILAYGCLCLKVCLNLS